MKERPGASAFGGRPLGTGARASAASHTVALAAVLPTVAAAALRIAAITAAAGASTLAGGCGQEGTIAFELVFPPGTTRLPEGTAKVRLVLDAPPATREADVAPDGSFALDLSVPARGQTGRVTFEALDADGVVLARGSSPPLPIAALSDVFRLFVAPPLSFRPAPDELAEPRDGVAATALPFGALFVGGRRADGTLSSEVAAYDVYTHEVQLGVPLPSGRARQAIRAGRFSLVYLFGGEGASGPVADAWAFDVATAPAGRWIALESDETLARAGAEMAELGGDRFLVTGNPPVLLDAASASAAGLSGVPPAAASAETATATGDGAAQWVVLVGERGSAIFDSQSLAFATLEGAPGRREHAAIALERGEVLAIGGVDPTTGAPLASALRLSRATAETIPLLARARRRPAVATTRRYLVVAGGFDAAGAPLPDAEVFDRVTLAPVAVVPLVFPRGGAIALSLPNDSLLLASGGHPLEIFTP